MDNIKTLHGFYRGVVTNNKDPLNQNRLQLQIQTSPGEVTSWAWSMEPANIHTPAPAIGQGVWVHFIAGDPEFPVWFGQFGTHQAKSKKLLVAPLANTVSLTGLTPYLKIVTQKDGTQEVDLMATLVAVAAKLVDHETRIHSLETQLTTLHNTLATRTSPSHTHGING
jgi:hypothetical protein